MYEMRSLLSTGLFLALTSAVCAAPDSWIPTSPPASPANNGKTCTVLALGSKNDDTPQIVKAFKTCNNGGTVVFPKGQNYWIGTKLNPVIYDVTVDWEGTWTMSDDLAYWRSNSYPVAFQNHHAGIVFTGERIHINGHGTGGIFGNGNVWYNQEKSHTRVGRPFPFVFWNVSDVFVEHYPPLWSVNTMNGTNMWFDNLYVNATAVNAPYGTNWVQNTDGFDTMDCRNIKVTNSVFQGGDDCLAIKPRSYNIYAQNITCHGGQGVAIGSLGQYLEDSSVINVTIKDVKILTFNKDMHNAAYIKTWVGKLVNQTDYESEYQPRGGGWGVVQNIRFENFYVQGANIGQSISQESGGKGLAPGSSLMEISNIAYVNFTGYIEGGKGSQTASISCSKVKPCFSIAFQNISLATNATGVQYPATGTCAYTAPGGVTGMVGC